MKIIGFLLIFLMMGVLIIPQTYASASVSIEMDKRIWEFGDFLTYVIRISEVTGNDATIYIRDESGKKFGPPPIKLTQLQTTIPSIYPLHPDLGFQEGKYYIDVEHNGEKDSVEFEIKDTGKAIIPIGVRANTIIWISENFPDEFFAKEIKTLMNKKILVQDNLEQSISNEFKLPSWLKTNTIYWWLNGDISDRDFVQALQYLITERIIVV